MVCSCNKAGRSPRHSNCSHFPMSEIPNTGIYSTVKGFCVKMNTVHAPAKHKSNAVANMPLASYLYFDKYEFYSGIMSTH